MRSTRISGGSAGGVSRRRMIDGNRQRHHRYEENGRYQLPRKPLAPMRCSGRILLIARPSFALDSSISIRASVAVCSRRFRSFCRHRRSKCRISAGVFLGSRLQSGSRSITRARISVDRIACERLPSRQHLVEHVPEREDVGALVHRRAPAPAPGLMYAAVPSITPPFVITA